MKAQHESFIAPVINTAVKIRYGTMLCLTVRNLGHSAAKNLRLSLDKDFHQHGNAAADSNLRNFPMFQDVIPSFSPGEEIFLMVAQGHDLNDPQLTPMQFAVQAKYEFGGKAIDHRHEINLSAYMRTSQNRNELLEEAEKIRKALETIAKK